MTQPLCESDQRKILAAMTTPCDRCTKAREALAKLEHELSHCGHLRLSGVATATVATDATDAEDDGRPAPRVDAWRLEHLKVECTRCSGTGQMPTDFGKQLLAFLDTFKGHAVSWKGGEPIPF